MLKSDIWSMGCIICEILSLSSCIFQCYNIRDKIRKVVEVTIKFNYINCYIGNWIAGNFRYILPEQSGLYSVV